MARPRWPFAVGAGVFAALGAAQLTLLGAWPARECLWLRWTGVPCPGCGATRCLGACGRLALGEALHWNPLVALAVIALLAWSGLALTHTELAAQITARVAQWWSPARGATLVVFNWLYLCWALPR